MKLLSDFIKRSNCISVSADKFDYDTYLSTSIKGLTRDKMPQIFDEHFQETIDHLKTVGDVEEIMLPIKDLKATQCEINVQKVKEKILNTDINTLKFICSNSNHIADGHHSHVAGLLTDPMAEVKVFRSSLDTTELLKILNNLKHTVNNEI